MVLSYFPCLRVVSEFSKEFLCLEKVPCIGIHMDSLLDFTFPLFNGYLYVRFDGHC